jgi:septal ring factor EnvC (AmiA/AmiB activator)
MSREDLLREEQGETARELAELLRLAQEMGRRLCNETHGDMYDEVRMLISLLHQTRAQADLIDAQLNSADPVVELMARRQRQ